METFCAIPLNHRQHFIGERSPSDYMSTTLLPNGAQGAAYLASWYDREDTYPSLQDSALLKPASSMFLDEKLQSPPRDHLCPADSFLPSPPPSDPALKHPKDLPDISPSGCMESCSSTLSPRRPLSRIFTGSHDGCYRSQPSTPPFDTPELMERNLLNSCESEPLSPLLTSPIDMLELPSLATFDFGGARPSNRKPHRRSRQYDGHEDMPIASSSKQLCCWDDPIDSSATCQPLGHADGRSPFGPVLKHLLSPDSSQWHSSPVHDNLLDDTVMEWSGDDDTEHRFAQSSTTPLDGGKARGSSLDSSLEESYDFMATMHQTSLRPLRSFTMPASLPSSNPAMPALDDLWDDTNDMDTTEDLLSSPRSPSLNLNLFDSPPLSSLEDVSPDSCSSAFYPSCSEPQRPLSLLDGLPIVSLFDNPLSTTCAPSSPHSPHMQLLPEPSDMSVDVYPVETISPSLLGCPISVTDSGLALDVDLTLEHSPSPEYESHDIEGQLEVPFGDLMGDLPDEEFQHLRAYYLQLSKSEAAAKDQEGVLDRRMKDVSALLKPGRAVPDPLVMRARRQELRAATELRTEARRMRKEEKHRLRELGSLLDLKLNTQLFNAKSKARSPAHLVADMLLKRQDRPRASGQRRAATCGGSSLRTLGASPLCSTFALADEDTLTCVDSDSI